MKLKIGIFLLLCGCSGTWVMPPAFIQQDIRTPDYQIRTYQKILSDTATIHIYIEGDGYAFNSHGQPTHDPTPHNTFFRKLATSDAHCNIAYIARPCQYNMSPACTQSDWTDGRFSQQIIDNISYVIKQIAKNRPVVLIGYSGGALLSGLIINQNPDINIKHWITVAGVLNHTDWTEYFGDTPLTKSINMDTMPTVPQTHYIAEHDNIVPTELSLKWTHGKNTIHIPNATHTNFPNLKIKPNLY